MLENTDLSVIFIIWALFRHAAVTMATTISPVYAHTVLLCLVQYFDVSTMTSEQGKAINQMYIEILFVLSDDVRTY